MDLIREMLDLGSFSNLWFWIVLVVIWTMGATWLIGIPADLLRDAVHPGSAAERDLRILLRIRAAHLENRMERHGVWMVGLGAFVLTVLALLGFLYGIEIAQAVFLIALPWSFCWLLTQDRLRAIAREGAETGMILIRLRRLRVALQAIGLVAVLVTAAWGMYVNASQWILG